jgi:hypothetical protein
MPQKGDNEGGGLATSDVVDAGGDGCEGADDLIISSFLWCRAEQFLKSPLKLHLHFNHQKSSIKLILLPIIIFLTLKQIMFFPSPQQTSQFDHAIPLVETRS